MKNRANSGSAVLVLGIGNILMGDEGIGVHVIRHLEGMSLGSNVHCLDGGTGSFLLLEAMQRAGRIILIDATADGNPPGTVRRLLPRFSSDYPSALTAHDIGLKDLLDAAYLTGGQLDVTLLAVSISLPQALGSELSPTLAKRLPEIAGMVLGELQCEYISRPVCAGQVLPA